MSKHGIKKHYHADFDPAEAEALRVKPRETVKTLARQIEFNAVYQDLAQESETRRRVDVHTKTTVLFGSQTGNAEKLAERLHSRLIRAGFAVQLQTMSSYNKAQLPRKCRLLIIVSTYGEGEPPDNTAEFYEFLHRRKVPRLEALSFLVLPLGDIGYEHFCNTGRDIDAPLEALSGKGLHPRVDCHVDYEVAAEAWMEGVLAVLA